MQLNKTNFPAYLINPHRAAPI